MFITLSGDIGGTKTLLRLTQKDESANLAILFEQRFISSDYGQFSDLLDDFFAQAQASLGQLPTIDHACFGIAGPVSDRRSHQKSHQQSQLTNLGWTLDSDRLAADFAIAKVTLINDFVAVGYGVLGLPESDLFTLQQGQRQEQAPIMVIGAGTGLGEAYLTWQGDRYGVYATEGGHTDFAPRHGLEIELLQYLQKRHERVSVERVVSGMGIVAIYQFLRDRRTTSEHPAIAEQIRRWEAGEASEAAAAIADGAIQGDPLAVQTIQMFLEAYAAEIGNFALKLIPNGGIYIAGGIAPKLLPLINASNFLAIIKSKGRVSPVLEQIPMHIVLNPQVGLIGAMLYANAV
ncbi:MAG: glucokinase [Pseudanabaenaceae cyanobacterium bins.39]|nr:glucokinase [Pseudanabaenaceae cyanobacterium bins.39]